MEWPDDITGLLWRLRDRLRHQAQWDALRERAWRDRTLILPALHDLSFPIYAGEKLGTLDTCFTIFYLVTALQWSQRDQLCALRGRCYYFYPDSMNMSSSPCKEITLIDGAVYINEEDYDEEVTDCMYCKGIGTTHYTALAYTVRVEPSLLPSYVTESLPP